MDASEFATRLATAPGDVELVELLAKGQERKRLLQLLTLAKKSSPEHVSVLTPVQRAAPAALRTVLQDPSAATVAERDTGYARIADTSRSESAPEADRLYGLGRFEAAVHAYQKPIQHDPHDRDAWAGLAVSIPPKDSGHQALHRIPEVLGETCRQADLLGEIRESPPQLARWPTRESRAEHVPTLSVGLFN